MIPIMDGRDEEKILEAIKKLAPHYVPEWAFDRENMEPGTALCVIFSEMLKETINRYNQVLQRNQMAFLNMLNAGILPAKPSEAYVSFILSTGTKEHVLVPKATKVIAEGNDKNTPVIFETADEMLATPAAPVSIFKTGANAEYINELENGVFSITDTEYTGFVLFGRDDGLRENLQEQSLYIQDSVMFNIKEPATISLKFVNTRKKYREQENYELLSDENICRWEFISQDCHGKWEWVPFDKTMHAGDSLVLFKQNNRGIGKGEIKGTAGNFIRCRLCSKTDDRISHIEFDEVHAASRYMDMNIQGGIKPDKLFINDVELKEPDFFPFREFYSVYDCFYVCCEEVFSKKGARIHLNFTIVYEIKSFGDPELKKTAEWKAIMKKKDLEEPPEPSKAYIESVVWEYWNGERWARLEVQKNYEFMFNGVEGETNVVFNCPEDIGQGPVNGGFYNCIRVRILKIWNAYKANNLYITPKIKKISLKYEYIGEKLPLESIYTLNNMEWKKYNLKKAADREPVLPFEEMDCKYPALYIGFDQPPLKGPIHLYFSLKKYSDETIIFRPVWEYQGKNGWMPLKVLDRTEAFTHSGSVTFAGPSDFAAASCFGKREYWIRVYNRGTALKPSNIRIHGIYINTVRAVQQESIFNEVPDVKTDGTGIECQLSRYPIISEEIFINEAGYISEKEQMELLKQKEDEIDYCKDEYGNLKHFWVRWKRVDDFLLSGQYDRHYMVDHSTGRIVLGSRYGKMFFSNPRSRIRVDYRIGGGSKGNVPAWSINKLKNSIAFVENVINHQASFGGCEMETQDETVFRETQALKHRNRAVTEEDIEALALASSRNIAKVKCIPNLNSELGEETGCITIVILPKGESLGDDFLAGLKEEVKKYILEKTSGMLAFGDKITVIAPMAVEISVTADIAVEDMEGMLEVEKEIVEKLACYLDPQTGNLGKKGWEIGEHPHQSNFYTLIKSVKKVAYIENLVVNIYVLKYGKRLQISMERLDEMPYAIVQSGEHQINVNVI